MEYNKHNKGFVGIGLLIAMIVTLIVGGGVVYYATKMPVPSSGNIEENDYYTEEDTQVSTQPPVEQECTKNTPPSITLVSPNGGETFAAGQQITVKWESCNVSNYIGVVLNAASAGNWYQGNPIILASGAPDGPTVNDGMETFTIPSSVSAGQYKIWVRHEYDDFTGSAYEDASDNQFTISGSNDSPSITLPTPYISAQNDWPPVIQNSTTPYVCNSAHSEMSDTMQKIIGRRTYCVTTFHEGAAGSTYKTYTYVTANGSGTKTTNFTLKYQNCDAYNDPTQFQCHNAQSDFNLDVIVNILM